MKIKAPKELYEDDDVNPFTKAERDQIIQANDKGAIATDPIKPMAGIPPLNRGNAWSGKAW